MEICKHCGKPLIMNGGKCVYCGKSPNGQINEKEKESLQQNLPPIRTFNVNGVSFNMILVEGGTFYMGLTPNEALKLTNEGVNWQKKYPLITLNSFYIGETVVTQALWKAVMSISDVTQTFWKSLLGEVSNPSKFKGDNLPVENVSWKNCYDFTLKLGEFIGCDFRLPTEAEWEFASKGGNNSKGYEFSGSDNLSDVAWFLEDGQPAYSSATKPVKSKLPNELGLYDMTGNVWEWCQDEYDDMAVEKFGDHIGNDQIVIVGNKGAKVLRGFSVYTYANTINSFPSLREYRRSDMRNPKLLDDGEKIKGGGHYDTFGFRLAMSVD